MANEKNLIPLSERSPSELRQMRQKGGHRSGEVRRNKKLLKECMLNLLDLPVSNTKQWNKLSKMGINPEEIDNRSLLTVSLFLKAVETGDVSAFKEIRDLIGERGEENDTGELERLIEGFKEL